MEAQDLITIIFSFCRNNAGWLFFWNRRKSFGIYNKESIVEKEKNNNTSGS